MRVDLYTKAVLTVIAGALLYLCVAVTPLGTPVSAQASPSTVHIGGWVDGRGTVHRLDTNAGLPTFMVVTGAATAGAPPATNAPLGLVGSPPTSRGTEAPSARIRCQATTQRGSQCSRMAPAGQRFCWQHAR
jgi:hypothetical protein